MPKPNAARPASNVPVSAAATANRYSTSPEASLTRLSPSSSTVMRGGRDSPCSTALAATVSDGETIAPSAKHAAHGSDGSTQCATIPTPRVVKATAPTANCRMILKFARKSLHTVKYALDSKSGGRKSTSARSGSSSMSGTPGISANAIPPRMKAAAGGMRIRRASNSRPMITAINRRMNSKRETKVKAGHGVRLRVNRPDMDESPADCPARIRPPLCRQFDAQIAFGFGGELTSHSSLPCPCPIARRPLHEDGWRRACE